MITVTCGEAGSRFPGFDNVAVTAAVAYVSSLGGGEVLLSPGTYELRDSVHLSSGVTLTGAGIGKTVLHKCASVRSATKNYCGYGHTEITVEESEKFKVGDGIYITDKNAGAFFSTQSTVTETDGDLIFFRHPLNADVAGARGGYIETLFPAIRGEDVDGCVIRDMTLDGNREQNGFINGCRGGGVFFIKCNGILMKNLRVTNFNADAVSYQQCTDMHTVSCMIDHNAGHAMHPGSGTVGSSIVGCELTDNGGNGIYYCLRIKYNICRGNVIRNNAKDGISVGHRDDCIEITDNMIENNGTDGLIFRNDSIPCASGQYSSVHGNTFRNNCRSGGTAEIFFPTAVLALEMSDNIVVPKDGVEAFVCNAPLADSYIWHNSFAVPDGICEAKAPSTLRRISLDGIPTKEYRHLPSLKK